MTGAGAVEGFPIGAGIFLFSTGSITPYVFTAWYLVKHRDKLTFL
jgi:hypothetical protein